MFTKDFWAAMGKVATSKVEDSSAMTPYRSAALVPIEPKPLDPKERYGLARLNKAKVHKCHEPGIPYHFFMFLTFRPIPEGSLYRCRCGIVYEYVGSFCWFPRTMDKWIKLLEQE